MNLLEGESSRGSNADAQYLGDGIPPPPHMLTQHAQARLAREAMAFVAFAGRITCIFGVLWKKVQEIDIDHRTVPCNE